MSEYECEICGDNHETRHCTEHICGQCNQILDNCDCDSPDELTPDEYLGKVTMTKNNPIDSAIDALFDAVTWQEWLAAMAAAVAMWSSKRNPDRCGFDPDSAQRLSAAIDAQPAHEIVRAHCGDNPDEHAWGLRTVVTGGISSNHLDILRRLRPGAHGGLVDIK